MSNAAQEAPWEKRRFTYADYASWELKEGERFELINGEAFMLAAPADVHQATSGEIFRHIANFLVGKPCKVRAAPYDVRLFYDEDGKDDTVVQPDITVICDENKRGAEGCRGAPDMIIEILSPSTASVDRVKKFRLYQQAGVREYWIVDPETKSVQVCVRSGEDYIVSVYEAGETVPVTVLAGCGVPLSDIFPAEAS
jgi:Uma2 family endonuclease